MARVQVGVVGCASLDGSILISGEMVLGLVLVVDG